MKDPELFDVIRSVNHLKTQVQELNKRIEFILKHPQSITTDDLINDKSARLQFHLSRSTLLRLRKTKQIAYTLLNKRIYYSLSSIKSLLSSNK